MKNHQALLTFTMQPTQIKPCMKDFISWFPNLQKVLSKAVLSVSVFKQIIASNQKIERLRKIWMEKLKCRIDFCKEKKNYLFLVSTVYGTRSNEAKLDQRRFRLDVRENSLTAVLINHWNSLRWENMSSPWLQLFKDRLKNYLWGVD